MTPRISLVCLLLYAKHLERSLAHSKFSIVIYWVNPSIFHKSSKESHKASPWTLIYQLPALDPQDKFYPFGSLFHSIWKLCSAPLLSGWLPLSGMEPQRRTEPHYRSQEKMALWCPNFSENCTSESLVACPVSHKAMWVAARTEDSGFLTPTELFCLTHHPFSLDCKFNQI